MSTHRQHAGFCSNLASNEVSFQLLWLSGIRISYEIYECAMSVTSGTANSNSYATCVWQVQYALFVRMYTQSASVVYGGLLDVTEMSQTVHLTRSSSLFYQGKIIN